MRSIVWRVTGAVALVDWGIVGWSLATNEPPKLHYFNAMLSVGIVAGLSWLIPPILVGLFSEEMDERKDEYLDGVRDAIVGAREMSTVVPLQQRHGGS